MPFIRDDDALAVLALCDALDADPTDAEQRITSITTARKHAHNVIARGRKRTKDEPEITPAEGDTE